MIHVNQPELGDKERVLLEHCIRTGWISSEGPQVAEFEEKMSAKIGRRFGVAVSSGSAALDVAVKAIGLGSQDEVVMPAFTIISCASSVVRAGARPVLVDADPHTWNMAVEEIERKITPRTKAVMAVHLYGLPVEMDRLMDIARRHRLRVIEDAAEAIGQTFRGQPCGGFGDVSVLSFYANKHVTTGEGGMVLTDDSVVAERCRSLRNLCFQAGKRFVHEELGWNYRMTNLQAAVGVAQLERLDSVVRRKRRMGQLYNELLADFPGIQTPVAQTPYAENIYWVYGVVLGDELNLSAEVVMQRLAERGVGSRPFFWPMHEQPVLRRMGLFENESYPVAEKLARKGIYLPSGAALTDAQIEKSAATLKEVISHAV
jgi:perosamine synthetase